jgi:RNA polymerase sigma-70 factor, ECF subfamily
MWLMCDMSSTGDGGPAPNDLRGDWLFATVYEELRGVAKVHMGRERPNHTLQTTALVHEVYVRLHREGRVQWQSRAQFMIAAAEAMRRILIERARARKRLKRGGGRQRIALEPEEVMFEQRLDDLLALNEALERLIRENEQWALVVKLRYFAGLSIPHTARVLDKQEHEVKRQWIAARAWLHQAIEGVPGDRSA